MRVLVTGSGGFAGARLARELLAAGEEVYGLVRPGGSPPPDGVVPLPCDLRDREGVRAAVQAARPAAIYQMAGLASGALQDQDLLTQANVLGARHVLEAAGRLGGRVRVLLVSTGYVYGECDPRAPATEAARPSPIGRYAESKWAMERMAREECPQNVALLIARPFTHTGPGQRPVFAVPSFARQVALAEAAGGEAAIRVGDLSPLRDFLDVRDVVCAYRLLMDAGEPGQVYNVASGEARSMADVLDILVGHARVPVRVERDPARLRPAEIQVNVGSAARLRARTGWQPRIAFEETVAGVLDYWRAIT